MAGKDKTAEAVAKDVPDNFEQALAELEKIVASMEAGDMSLEASLSAYERGVALARICQAQLQAAEQQVRVLEQDFLRPFDPTPDASAEGAP